ncbi:MULTISPECIES: MFS transporter [unclassified Streptomyces]|uniref:MFS transporter n=1 Tax=Streptomyces sp. NBC_00119 TaxID=2975659 RepID=A0AAU1UCE6_9ACTN|nr:MULTISPECIES: MFS transporter [unclassified Streptomyces]MCX4645838.1 MFS transporter [Streptomyces sp. NBC_01446]MCX5318462.1 MFS transporter [Streptomyces sp. NBC_00120]
MYVADSRAAASAEPAARPPAGRRGTAIAPTVLALGSVSLITDVSSEMVTAVLPLYLVAGLGLSPLGFGLLDGVYNGFSALVRLVGGHFADRGGGRHKTVALFGYGLSALCKPLLLLAATLPTIGMVLAADRTGKGLRTAPRDALISLSSTPATRGRAFGVHRAMDTTGALLGPLAAFLILRATTDGYDAVFTVSFCVAALGVLVLLLFVPRRHEAERVTAEDSRPAPAQETAEVSHPAPAQETAEVSHPAPAQETAEVSHPAPARPTLRSALALLRRREVRRTTVCALLLGLATVSDSFIYLLLQRRLGVPDQWFALLPLGTAAAFLLLAAPLGRLADRLGSWRVFLAGHAALLAAYGLLLSPWHGSALPYAVLALHGCFYAATDGVLMAAASTAIPQELRSSGLAVVQTGQALARFVCSIGFGAAWTAWGDRTALGAATVALAAGAAVAYAFRPTAPTPAEVVPA